MSETLIQVMYMAAAACFILSLKWLSAVPTARRGVITGIIGMLLAVVGTLLKPELAGYASNSKYPFMGGIRSSAQLISYEIAMGLSVIPVFMLVGDLRLSSVVDVQTGSLFHWLIFKQPLAFAIFLGAAFAETNRLPFDMPEAEQELAGGYNVEYSSIKFALFFMGEYANMIAASAMMVTLFFGGWTLPWFGLDQPATTLLGGLLHVGIFIAKLMVLMVTFIWVRWMWPRFRYDQLMDLGWKRFVPLGLANIVVTAIWFWLKA